MWKIIRADIKYYKWLFMWLYVFVMPFYVANAILGDLHEHLISIVFYTLPIIGIFVSNEEKKSKRTRLHVALPVPIQQLGISRYPIITAYWISLVFLFCMSVILGESADLHPWRVLSITATGPFIAACMTIHRDLSFSRFNHVTQIALKTLIVLLAVIMAILYFAHYVDEIFKVDLIRIFRNPSIAVILVMGTVVLMFTSIRLFMNRSTYVM